MNNKTITIRAIPAPPKPTAPQVPAPQGQLHPVQIVGGLTAPSKMPCPSFSVPVVTCNVGSRMAEVPGSVCASCYAARGHYILYQNTVEPLQFARYDALLHTPRPLWVAAFAALLRGEPHFRWFDAGDLPSLDGLERIVEVCRATPWCAHWLPTREYGIVRGFVLKHGRDAVPGNLVIRLSAMFPDRPAPVPASLRGIKNIRVGNVHRRAQPVGQACPAPKQKNRCGACRACWDAAVPAVSYEFH
jgi:hypothetical protein